MSEVARRKEIENGSWVRQAFFVPRLGGADEHVRRALDVDPLNFYDTTLGGNRSMNPPSQFTDLCDTPMDNIIPGLTGGMGTYYAEAIDNNAQRISLQFGQPEYNSLTRFFSSYYDRDMGRLVRNGDASSLARTAGKAFGMFFTLPVQAFFGVNYLYNRISAFLTKTPYSKFYYMKATMPLYWTAVSLLANQLATTMGLTDGRDVSEVTEDGIPDKVYTSDELASLKSILPDLLIGDGDTYGIDIYSVATRSQRLANKFRETLANIAEETNSRGEYIASVKSAIANSSTWTPPADIGNLNDYIARYAKSAIGGDNREPVTTTPDPNESGVAIDTDVASTSLVSRDVETLKSFNEEFLAQIKDGSAFVTFSVESSGSETDSFTNTTKESALSSMVNAAAGSARDVQVNLADGNLADGLIGDTIEKGIGAVKEFAGGILESVGLSGLSQLGGGAFVDIPEVYDSSTAELSTTSYKMRLTTPYGNKLSVFMNVYVPLCMILAGGLPRSAGKHSYYAPFMCRIFSQGRQDYSGYIDSITIERGTDNVGWSKDGLPTTVDVTFTVKNIDPIMHMPITESISDKLLGFSHFDEDSALTNYMSALSSMSLYDKFYLKPRLKLAWNKTAIEWEQQFSVSRMAQMTASSWPGQLISSLAKAGELN